MYVCVCVCVCVNFFFVDLERKKSMFQIGRQRDLYQFLKSFVSFLRRVSNMWFVFFKESLIFFSGLV